MGKEITQQQREVLGHIRTEYGKEFKGSGPEQAYRFIKSIFPLYREQGFSHLD